MSKTLGTVLKEARTRNGLSLRKVEEITGIHNAHLSQIENGTIQQPEMVMLFDLASLYGMDYGALLRLAGYTQNAETSGRARQRMTVAMRTMGELTPREQTEVLRYMAELKGKHSRDR